MLNQIKILKLNNRKGVSLIISYVILIGFSISLAIMVSMWMKGQSEEVVESWETYDCDIDCQDVFLSVCYGDGLSVTNRGNFNIKALRIQNSTGSEIFLVNIGLGETEVLNIGEQPINIVPAINNEGNYCFCADKKIEVDECV